MSSFFVPGVPQPKGSLTPMANRHTGRIAMIEGRRPKARKAFAGWMKMVKLSALAAGVKPIAGPVSIDVTFIFPRPKSAKKRAYPCVKPDIDKLLRAVLDALTGVAYRDDGQVTHIGSRKLYDDRMDGEGARICVETQDV